MESWFIKPLNKHKLIDHMLRQVNYIKNNSVHKTSHVYVKSVRPHVTIGKLLL